MIKICLRAMFLVTGLAWSTFSLGKAQVQGPALLPIMAQMASAAIELETGIFYGNCDVIKNGARDIANHPAPSDIDRIKKILGPKIAEFKAIDQKVHKAASGILKSCDPKNLDKVLTLHHEMLQSCVECHSRFREQVKRG